MPVFISYSHNDKDFVTELALQLVVHKTRVWIDQWELNVGDSLIQRIQSAIQDASALLVILSKSSVESEWCKKELTAGLLRELEEKKVLVLPAVIDDCEIPLFLRDKLYADFHNDKDQGLEAVLNAVAQITADRQGRVANPEWYIDWSISDGYLEDGRLFIQITLIEHGVDKPFSLLSQIDIVGNGTATKRYKKYADADLDWFELTNIILAFAQHTKEQDIKVLLENADPSFVTVTSHDPKLDMTLTAKFTTRRLGMDTGRDILVYVSDQFSNIAEQRIQSMRKLTAEEFEFVKQMTGNSDD